MYPAMARTFRAVGAQFAAMFSYDMLRTASRNLGWQTHYLNLVYTPRKAMSAIIAAEAMRRLPRMRSYGAYPGNTRFGDFRVSHGRDLGELVARDAFLYAGSTTSAPPDPAALRRIAGYGSSPIVAYEGEGLYFLDKVRPGLVAARGLSRRRAGPRSLRAAQSRQDRHPRDPPELADDGPLPDLGDSFTVQSVAAGNPRTAVRAVAGRVTATPGVYVLSAAGPVDAATLPAYLGHLRFAEYHAPATDYFAAIGRTAVHAPAARRTRRGAPRAGCGRAPRPTPPSCTSGHGRGHPIGSTGCEQRKATSCRDQIPGAELS